MIELVVIGVAVVGATLLVGARHVMSGDTPLDVEAEEQWLARHSPDWLAGLARTLDRRVIGGIAVGSAFIVTFVAALAVGRIFSGIDDERGIAQWDVAAAEYGRDNATDGSISSLRAVTDLGGTLYLLAVMALIGVYHVARRKDWGPLAYLATVGIGVSLLNNGLKLIVDRGRPEIGQLAGHAGSSFPSGHSAAAAACWAAIMLVLMRRRSAGARLAGGFVAVLLAIAVATTRVLLGVHWLSDVVAGVLVGWAWFAVTTLAFGGQFLRLGEPAERIADDGVEGEALLDGADVG